jgi:hypothetical protein
MFPLPLEIKWSMSNTWPQIMGVGDSHMQCFDLTLHSVAGGIVGPPSTDWVMLSRYHPPTGMTLLGVERPYTNVHCNFKIKFQTYIFEIIFKDNFLGLMLAYTTSDIYLTLRFKF